jgi:hypothetical protein
MTSDLLEEIEAEYDLCINKPEEYQQKVDRISSLFFSKGKRSQYHCTFLDISPVEISITD